MHQKFRNTLGGMVRCEEDAESAERFRVNLVAKVEFCLKTKKN